LAVSRDRLIDTGTIARVVAGNCLQEQGGAGHVACEWADLVERAGEGDQAEARYAAVSWFHTDDTAQTGWLTDGAPGVAAQRERCFPGRDGGRRTAAGAAGDAVEIPGVSRDLEGAVLGGRTHGKFVHVGLAQEHGVRLFQAGNCVSVIG